MHARTLFAALLAIAAIPAVLAADNRETRAVAGFSSLGLSAPVKVQVTQGDTESLVLEGTPEALADIETFVEDGTLKIRQKSHNWKWATVRAQLAVKKLDAIAVSGSGDVIAPALRVPALKIAISGSGDVRVAQLDSTSLTVAISGSGDVAVGGKAETLTTNIAGSGDLKAAKLETRKTRLSIAGSGDATVWAREALAVSVVGSGDVRYYGDPTVEKSVLGSGSVKRLGANPT